MIGERPSVATCFSCSELDCCCSTCYLGVCLRARMGANEKSVSKWTSPKVCCNFKQLEWMNDCRKMIAPKNYDRAEKQQKANPLASFSQKFALITLHEKKSRVFSCSIWLIMSLKIANARVALKLNATCNDRIASECLFKIKWQLFALTHWWSPYRGVLFAICFFFLAANPSLCLFVRLFFPEKKWLPFDLALLFKLSLAKETILTFICLSRWWVFHLSHISSLYLM